MLGMRPPLLTAPAGRTRTKRRRAAAPRRAMLTARRGRAHSWRRMQLIGGRGTRGSSHACSGL